MEIPPIAAARAGPAGPERTGPERTGPERTDADLRAAAEAFEAAFLSEMLKYTGLNANPESFGGGAGEEAFASLLTDEYATLLAERGGVGIAEQIFEALKQRTRDA